MQAYCHLFFSSVCLPTRPVPVSFLCKSGLFLVFSSSVLLQTRLVPFLELYCCFSVRFSANPAYSLFFHPLYACKPGLYYPRIVFLFFCTFHCKPGLFLFVSSKNPAGALLFHPLYVCRPGLFLSDLCMFENPACSFSLCKTRPIPFLCVSTGQVYSCSCFFYVSANPAFPFLCMSANPIYSCSFFLYVCKTGTSSACLQNPVYTCSFFLFFFCVSAKPAYSLFFIL